MDNKLNIIYSKNDLKQSQSNISVYEADDLLPQNKTINPYSQ